MKAASRARARLSAWGGEPPARRPGSADRGPAAWSRGRRVGATVVGCRVPASSAARARKEGRGRRARGRLARVVPRRRRRRARARALTAWHRGANPVTRARRPRLGARRDAHRARRLTPKPAVDQSDPRQLRPKPETRVPEAPGSSGLFAPRKSRGGAKCAGEIARDRARRRPVPGAITPTARRARASSNHPKRSRERGEVRDAPGWPSSTAACRPPSARTDRTAEAADARDAIERSGSALRERRGDARATSAARRRCSRCRGVTVRGAKGRREGRSPRIACRVRRAPPFAPNANGADVGARVQGARPRPPRSRRRAHRSRTAARAADVSEDSSRPLRPTPLRGRSHARATPPPR